MKYFFPLPYKGQNRIALPGLEQLRVPASRDHTVARRKEQSWEEIADIARNQFAEWLPGGEWWDKEVEEACASKRFINLFKEALEVSVKIATNQEAEDWRIKLFGEVLACMVVEPGKFRPTLPDDWEYSVLNGKQGEAIEVRFAPISYPISAAIMPDSINLKVVYGSPYLRRYKHIAISQDLFTLYKKNPGVAQCSASLLRELADRIEPADKITRQGKLHQLAMVSILYAWWVKRGGSNKKFPLFVFWLVEDANPIRSETLAKAARERLNPQTIVALQLMGRMSRDFRALEKFLKM